MKFFKSFDKYKPGIKSIKNQAKAPGILQMRKNKVNYS